MRDGGEAFVWWFHVEVVGEGVGMGERLEAGGGSFLGSRGARECGFMHTSVRRGAGCVRHGMMLED